LLGQFHGIPRPTIGKAETKRIFWWWWSWWEARTQLGPALQLVELVRGHFLEPVDSAALVGEQLPVAIARHQIFYPQLP